MGNQKLLKKIRAKDQDEISDLYLKSKTSFVKYFKFYAGIDTQEAEEICQEAFYSLYRRIKDSERPILTQLDQKNYLYQTGRNLVSKEYKRKLKFIHDLNANESASFDPSKEIENYFENETKKEIVRITVQALTEPCKSILSMFYWGKLSYSEMLMKLTTFSGIESLKAQKYKCMQSISKTIKGIFKTMDLV